MSGTTATFLSLVSGRRFGLVHGAEENRQPAGAILYVHPFAEEMNKSRRMAALQSRALAASGWTVLQIDLFGCGDSEGEFGEASWNLWVDDISAATEWLRAETGLNPALWGLRAGCLLAAQSTHDMNPMPDLLLWQPVISGNQYLHQFLRTKVAGQWTSAEGIDRIGTRELRAQLEHGQSVEVGGYTVAPPLALGLEGAELLPPAGPTRVAWLEVGAGERRDLSPIAAQQVAKWQTAGQRVDVRVVEGLPFWQTQEIAECPELIEATLQAVELWRR